MQKMTRKTATLAALLVMLAPALSQATDAAYPSAPAYTPGSARLAQQAAASALKADDFKEADLWGRIRTGYAIPDLNNDLVAKHVAAYAAHPDSLARTSARASRYL
ncbi:MAG: lytic transglycosylase, partial [Massilia sp.]|nr:lytic transglycosylase [Massilia sp.]